MLLDTPINELPRTSARTIQRLQALEIHTYYDLLHYYPSRHDDRSLASPIGSIQAGEKVTISGTIQSLKNNFTKRGFKIQTAKLADDSGSINLVWYNQMYLMRTLQEGMKLAVYGEVEQFGKIKQMKPQEYEIVSDEGERIHTGRLVPIYALTYGISTKTIREKIFWILQNLKEEIDGSEYLPTTILKYAKIIEEPEAIRSIHFPKTSGHMTQAYNRLAFDELFIRLLASRKVKEQWDTQVVSKKFKVTSFESDINTFKKGLPFKLTDAQQRVIDEITKDLQSKKPMNRFLQGDVGSGKTVVAAIAAYIAKLNGMQTLIMAPTEILAQQHYQTLSALFDKTDVTVALHTRSHRTLVDSKGKNAHYDIIVGTQALITKSIAMDHVGLVVIDEQHRFGVKQRAMLKEKGSNPHLLTMTATPIPRTVALTLYSELDLSTIDEMPKGRKLIKTYVINKEKRNDCYVWIQKQIQKHKDQVYVVYPLIDESESETMKTVKAAAKEFEELTKIFKTESVALLHGKIKSKDKETIMGKFKDQTHDILVATSVVEVGVDVRNATIMLIEGAERFGLAQLHQLRGRVGRGDKQSYCFLFTSDGKKSHSRLSYFAKTHNGMKLSEFDLKIRGAGNMYGTEQHGYTDLKLADITNATEVQRAQASVDMFIKEYSITHGTHIKKLLDQYQTNQISRD
ncbi:MAG: ATP-dependent DNA helicase RecG [bacterium]|nr:ATP-dependent DNA helicase RecG [bacterium]